MTNPVIVDPVAGNDPCGTDLAHTQDMFGFGHALETVRAMDAESVVDGELAPSNAPTPHDVISMAETLSAKTKSIAVIAPYAEASWLAAGLPAFAEAMEDLVAVAQSWPDGRDGVYPRADEEDGDLGMRAAPLGRLLNGIPALVQRIGWGGDVALTKQMETDRLLKGVFESWRERLEPAFGPELPSCEQAWSSLRQLTVGLSRQTGTEPEQNGEAAPGGAQPIAADAWETLERAAALMAEQDRHSPALPVLHLLASWRPMGIIEIAETMKASGVPLEQLLDSVKKNLTPRK